jgi:predicted transcriptional regulator
MRRLLVQLDEETYSRLKKQANKEKRSMASIVRESLVEKSEPRRKLSIKDFKFVGAGSSEQGDLAPVSENHDAALADAIMSRWRK